MKMVRSFLPVGQGAFYCEQFKNNSLLGKTINIVYDCGSSTDVELVKKQIRATFNKNEPIQAVFISHLHEDHINGLDFLLEYCDVKNIVFPFTSNEEKTILLLYNLVNEINQESFSFSFIKNPRNAIESKVQDKQLPRLLQIIPQEFQGNRNIEDSYDTIRSGIDLSHYIFDNKLLCNCWLYIPFNFQHKNKYERLMKEINLIFGNSFNEKLEIEELWRTSTTETKNKIKKAYESLPGSLNTNSMTLYSGTSKYSGVQFVLCNHSRSYPCCCCDFYYKNVGCLYTGDYDAGKLTNFEELRKKYIKYWKNIGCIQIPHHGSKNNFNNHFSKLDAYFVISAGKNNKYRHPHSYVMKDLLLNDHYPFIVTEEIGSAVYLIVDIDT